MLDPKKVEKIRELCKEVAGQDGVYVLMLAGPAPKSAHDAQVWCEGNNILCRGLVEVGRDFVIQRGLDCISPIRAPK